MKNVMMNIDVNDLENMIRWVKVECLKSCVGSEMKKDMLSFVIEFSVKFVEGVVD